ncbi:MAG: hypothetical protein ACRCWJ_18140 [Casimicrobium sp.]
MPFIASTDPLHRGEPVYVEQEFRIQRSNSTLQELRADMAKLTALKMTAYLNNDLREISSATLITEAIRLMNELKRRGIYV